MKNKVKVAFLIFIIGTYTIFSVEMMMLLKDKSLLENGEYALPQDSYSYKLANESPNYIPNMKKGVSTRIDGLVSKILQFTYCAVFTILALFDTPRNFIFSFSKNYINLYMKNLYNIPRDQVGLINIFLFAYCLIGIYDYMEPYIFVKGASGLFKILIFLFIYAAILPVVVLIIYVLLRKFGVKMILAIYFAVLLKNIYELTIEDDLDRVHMVKLNKDVFDDDVRDYLEKNKLSDKIYADTSPKNDTNAALVGLEGRARIELYGDFDKFEREEADGIFMHEIGHAEDHSLLKKASVYFALLYIEMCFLVYLYNVVSHNVKCERLSRDTMFLLLTMSYFLVCREWLMVFYKLSSQRAEIAADNLAKKHGYNLALAEALFKICLTESTYIKHSYLYNKFTAMHPSIYSRIEYLSK